MNTNTNYNKPENSTIATRKKGQIYQNQTKGENNRTYNEEQFERARDLRNF